MTKVLLTLLKLDHQSVVLFTLKLDDQSAVNYFEL
jgi:hypothetical protein